MAHIIVLPSKWVLVSGSTCVFSIPGHLGGARVFLPAFVACDKRGQSPSAALKLTLSLQEPSHHRHS